MATDDKHAQAMCRYYESKGRTRPPPLPLGSIFAVSEQQTGEEI
jgi:hypothetical protein